MAEQESRDPVSRIMNAAWPEYGGNHQTIEFWNDFGEGVQFALKHLEATNGWLPIETAPRDGTLILASSINHDRSAVVGWQRDDGSGFYGEDHWSDVGSKNAAPSVHFNGRFFTHWMPLPPPPIPHPTAA